MAASTVVNDILFKEILVQDHFYREIFFITSFFELDNCLPLLMMNNVTFYYVIDSEQRLSVRLCISRIKISAKYTAFECLFHSSNGFAFR